MKKISETMKQLYRMPPGYAPSSNMLSEVGLDFDDDLGGLKKNPPLRPERKKPRGFWGTGWPAVIIAVIGAVGWFMIPLFLWGVYTSR